MTDAKVIPLPVGMTQWVTAKYIKLATGYGRTKSYELLAEAAAAAGQPGARRVPLHVWEPFFAKKVACQESSPQDTAAAKTESSTYQSAQVAQAVAKSRPIQQMSTSRLRAARLDSSRPPIPTTLSRKSTR